jgi:hypothetical protein
LEIYQFLEDFMANIEITLQKEADVKTIMALHKITGMSLSETKEKIVHGSPLFAKDISFDELYYDGNVVPRLLGFFQEKNLDVIITCDRYANKNLSLDEFLKKWNEVRRRIFESDEEFDDDEYRDTIVDYLIDFVKNIKENIDNLAAAKQEEYSKGQLTAYNKVLTLLRDYASAMGFHCEELMLNSIDDDNNIL